MKLYHVIPDKLYGSGVPESDKDYKRWDIFDSVVSLTEPFRLHYLEKAAYEMKFNVLKSEIPDFGAPDHKQAGEIVDWIHKEITRGKKVVVHCYIGRGRTGTLLACYLVRYGDMTPEEAIKAVRKQNHEAIETVVQEKCVRNFS